MLSHKGKFPDLLFTREICHFVTKQLFLLFFLTVNKTLRLNNLKTRSGMNAKVSVLITCVEAIKYLLLYNSHHCNFNHIFHVFPAPKLVNFHIFIASLPLNVTLLLKSPYLIAHLKINYEAGCTGSFSENRTRMYPVPSQHLRRSSL